MYDLSIDKRARLHQTAFTYILPDLFLTGLYRDIIYRGYRIYMEIIDHCSHITDMQQKMFLKCYSEKSKQKGSSTLLGNIEKLKILFARRLPGESDPILRPALELQVVYGPRQKPSCYIAPVPWSQASKHVNYGKTETLNVVHMHQALPRNPCEK
ncbi:uncharacterized protein LOC119289730 [Triticum dicoccoides]|uniref:uncharacterized protein LOC119289730 n=1 Tax=Triticum dicoccoides TaxID=85692 RepID=UPI00188E6AEA|nr:uncharacterized protein LOC119289730 [Triticum dicoccoides]